jgi:hypothetical protein
MKQSFAAHWRYPQEQAMSWCAVRTMNDLG